ncbi:hypothetical protein [Nocardioides panacisoli]|uniref:Uncharacterized protein n=1 Tax=Nocardioides panacisoli TaxID=627624 RepID=A0ABP7IW30_9ACTN
MGRDDEFGPDTDAIRRWLSQRETYRADPGRHRGEARASDLPSATAAPPPPPAPPAQSSGPDGREVGRSVLEALGSVTPPPAAPTPTAPSTAAEARLEALISPPVAAGPTEQTAPAARPEPAAPAAQETPGRHAAAPPAPSSGTSTDLDFKPRTRARTAMGLLLLAVLVGTAAAAYYAVQQPSTLSYGLLGTLGVLTLVVWAVRASTTTTRVQVRRGVLEVRRGGGLEIADLANPYTPILILGVPERRNWRVLVERVDRPLIEIDASMVEPYAFTGLLLRIRPDLWDAAVDEARADVGVSSS